MGNKGSATTTTNTAPNPVAGQDYYNLLNQAQNVAATPYNAYSGQLVAPVNSQQYQGIGGINANAGFAQPFINQAAGYATNAAQPLTAQQIAQYQNPYTQSVVNATQQQFANTNAQQQEGLLGSLASQGALGGDRAGIQQSILAGQQQSAQAPVIAGLESQGYQSGVNTALAEQQNQAQAAYSLGNLGIGGQNAALSGANAQVGAGTLEQQTQQAQNSAAYQQFEQQQAYPFQTTQWLAGLDTGVGSQLGGTGATTQPPPNQTSQYAGLALAAAGLFANRGGRIQGLATGGTPYGDVSAPWAQASSYVPTMQISPGRGAPQPGGMQNAVQSPQQMMTQATQLAKGIGGAYGGMSNIGNDLFGSSPSYGGGNIMSGDTWGGSAAMPLDGLSADDYGKHYGGRIHGLATGGAPYGGLPLPSRNRIELNRTPVRAGLGLASFVPRRKLADGGTPYDSDYFDQTFGTSPRVLVPPGGLSGPQRDIVSDPAAMADYASEARANATQGVAPVAPGVAVSQSNDDSDALPPQITGVGSAAAPDDALAYSGDAPATGAPAPQQGLAASDQSHGTTAPHGLGLPSLFGVSSDAKTALLAAGLGMLSSRSPFAGVGIGEGGLQGLATYQGLQKQHLAEQTQSQNVDLRVKQLNQQAKAEQDRLAQETKSEEDKYTRMTPAQSAEIQFRKQNLERENLQPVKAGTDMSTGTDIYVVRDPSAPGGFRRIDASQFAPQTGTPNGGPGAPVSQAAPNAQQPAANAGDEKIPTSATYTAGDAPPNVRAEVLQTLDPQLASQVKALDEGRMQFPTGFALKSPYWQNMLRLVSNYDPSFDGVNYNARAKTRADFVAGKSAQNITSFNTAIGHLDTLDKSIDDLGNTRFGWLNPMLQGAKSAYGDPQYQEAQKRFAAARQAVTDELTRAFRGSGGNVHDIVGWEQTLNQADSPVALHAATKAAVDLLRSRIEAVGDQYNRGMGTTRDPLTLLNPHAAETVRRLSGEAAPASATSAPTAGTPPVPGARLYQGTWYTRGPNGEAVPVQ